MNKLYSVKTLIGQDRFKSKQMLALAHFKGKCLLNSLPLGVSQISWIHLVLISSSHPKATGLASYFRETLNNLLENLSVVQGKWGSACPKAGQPCLEKWELSLPFFDYPTAIHKVMYTTNTLEGYHRQLRKVIKTKVAFISDVALQKLVYLVIQNLPIKWETTTYRRTH